MPLPRPEATPPVTKMNFGCSLTTGRDSIRGRRRAGAVGIGFLVERATFSPELRSGPGLDPLGLGQELLRMAHRGLAIRRDPRASGRAPRPARGRRGPRSWRSPASLRTRTCRSAKQAICGRCVTTRTWRSRASRASRRPTASPARPPIPASTSSKTRVGTSSRSARTLRHASIVRESSPPDAAFASGSGGLPGPRRQPELDPLGTRRTGLGQRVEGHLEARRPASPAARARSQIAAARAGAASRRGRGSPSPHVRRRRPASDSTSAASSASRSSAVVRDVRRSAASARNPSTSASVSPYLRRNAFSACDALPYLLQPRGIGGEALPVVAEVARELGGLGRERARPFGEPSRPRDPSTRPPPRRARRSPSASAAPSSPASTASALPASSIRRSTCDEPCLLGLEGLGLAGLVARSPRSRAPGTRAGRARAPGRGRPRGAARPRSVRRAAASNTSR